VWDLKRLDDWNSTLRRDLEVVNGRNQSERYFHAVGNDPHIRRDDINLDYHARFVLLEYSIKAENDLWRPSDIFITKKAGDSFSGDLYIRRHLFQDGKTHWALFDLDTIPQYSKSDRIYKFRWDPLGNSLNSAIRPETIVFFGTVD
jgi:hypothetical protein